MSRVWNQTMVDIAETSGCDWDFVVDMYNYIFEKHGDVDLDRFMVDVAYFDWSARGDGRFQNVLIDLCERTGYTYSYLFDRLMDVVFDPDNGEWEYFVGVTMERDW